jgi:hypothetical protein
MQIVAKSLTTIAMRAERRFVVGLLRLARGGRVGDGADDLDR